MRLWITQCKTHSRCETGFIQDIFYLIPFLQFNVTNSKYKAKLQTTFGLDFLISLHIFIYENTDCKNKKAHLHSAVLFRNLYASQIFSHSHKLWNILLVFQTPLFLHFILRRHFNHQWTVDVKLTIKRNLHSQILRNDFYLSVEKFQKGTTSCSFCCLLRSSCSRSEGGWRASSCSLCRSSLLCCNTRFNSGFSSSSSPLRETHSNQTFQMDTRKR